MKLQDKLTISPAELKQILAAYLHGLGFDASNAVFTEDSTGTVTVEIDKDLGAAANVVVPEPAVTPTAAYPVSPFSVTGRATCFGFEDKGDNGIGFFNDPATGKPYETNNKTIVGVAIPEEVLMSTLGLLGKWAQNAEAVQKWHADNSPKVKVWSAKGITAVADLVDVGPSAFTGNALDRTYGLCEAIGEVYDANSGSSTNTYSLLVGGNPVEIKGWPIK